MRNTTSYLIQWVAGILLMFVPQYVSAVTKAEQLRDQGDSYYYAAHYGQALDCYADALELAEQKDEKKLYASLLGRIGNIYGIVGDTHCCKRYQQKGFERAMDLGDSTMAYLFASNLVEACCMNGDVDLAKHYYAVRNQLPCPDVTDNHAYSLFYQGLIAKEENKLSMATYYFNQALDYAKKKKTMPDFICEQMLQIAEIEIESEHNNKAIKLLREAEDIARKTGTRSVLSEIYRKLATAYFSIGEKALADSCNVLYLAENDSMYIQKEFKLANNKVLNYENRVHEALISDLTSRNQYLMLLVIVGSIALGIITLLYVLLRRRRKKLQEAHRLLIRKNEELMAARIPGKMKPMQPMDLLQHQATNEPSTTMPPLSKDQAMLLSLRINEIMNDLTVITRQDFSLAMLAQLTDSNTRYVSWVINDSFGRNFKSLLNERRIMEACRRLTDTRHYGHKSIQEIYEELGYQSATAFIAAFKKENGMTPSQYQRLAQKR